MKRTVAALAAAVVVALAAGAGFVAAGHENILTVVVADTPFGFHHNYYRCWQTKVFSLCDSLPDNLDATGDHTLITFPDGANVTF